MIGSPAQQGAALGQFFRCTPKLPVSLVVVDKNSLAVRPAASQQSDAADFDPPGQSLVGSPS
jgi:hypothetical protein